MILNVTGCRNNGANLYYHTIWVVKLKQPLIDQVLQEQLYPYVLGKVVEYGGEALAIGGLADHLHLLFAIPGHFPLAVFIGRLKGSSSHGVNHFLCPGTGFSWQRGYGLLEVGRESILEVTAYIENQETLHRNKEWKYEWEIPYFLAARKKRERYYF